MPELLTLPARTPALAASNAGVPVGSGAAIGDAGAFGDMLQAGLAGTGAATGTRVPGVPSAAKPVTQLEAEAGTDRLRPANGDGIASDWLSDLLAYGAAAVATAPPAAVGAETPTTSPDAAPALMDQPSDAATLRMAAVVMAQPKYVQPAIATFSNGDGQADPSATAVAPTRSGRPVAGHAPQTDPVASAVFDAGPLRAGIADFVAVPRNLPRIPENRAEYPTHPLSESAEAGTRAAEGTADVTEGVRASRQRRSTSRDDLRSATESPDAARQRDARPADRLIDSLADRAADRPADMVARIETMVRNDLTPRLHTPPPAPQPAGPAPVVHVDHSLGSPEWQREFGSQVSVLVSRREPQAEIRLNPPQLGPVEVRIGLQGDQVSLAFTAPHPDTRAAIENALPQLREMFAGNGLALGNASVNAESSQQQSHRGTHQNVVSLPNQEPTVAESMPLIRSVAVRLVDTFV